MILVDTSVWIDHLRRADEALTDLLDNANVLAHPFVTGELALGSLRQREIIIGALLDLPQAIVADDTEILGFIGQHALHARGIGYVDAHLLAAARLTGVKLWTRDRRLRAIARELDVAATQDS